MTPFKNPTILKILDYYKDLWALSYLSGVSHWDMETYMPEKASQLRGEAMAKVSSIKQRMFLSKDFSFLINKASSIKDLNDSERGVVRLLKQSLKIYQKVPSEFLENFEKLTNTATVVWREAKKSEKYSLFEPYLKKVFDENSKLAEYLGYNDSPYDALLDLYEEDLKVKDVTSHFESIIPPLKNLLDNIVSSKNYKNSHFLENAKYDKEKMVALNEKILKDLWSSYGKEGNLRLDISSHPFSTSFNKNDTRITTWYHEKDFARSLMAVVHEFGHALYDLQSSDSLEMTPIAGGSSLVIHESQSRFWENHVGRSKEFIEKYIKDIRGLVSVKDLSTKDVYEYLNQVKPSLLRVEADEVTYHMHIALRFEIERDVIEGKLKVKDIKSVWNEKMKNYLGISPNKDSEGVLQDIHWSGGSVGYFPTYSMGTFLGAQWEKEIENKDIKSDDYNGIKKFLEKSIHQSGSTYTMEELLKKNKMKFDSNINLKYLQDKYNKIYSLN